MTDEIKPGEREPFSPGRTTSTCKTLQIKCPYFCVHGKLEVRCRGITDDSRVALRFLHEDALKQHEKLYCKNRYWCCEICRMLDQIEE